MVYSGLKRLSQHRRRLTGIEPAMGYNAVTTLNRILYGLIIEFVEHLLQVYEVPI